jgi:hypothetical protein
VVKKRRSGTGLYASLPRQQIAKDPSLRPLSLDKLASKLEPKVAKPEWVKKLGRQIKAKTIKRALGPAKEWREKVARLP